MNMFAVTIGIHTRKGGLVNGITQYVKSEGTRMDVEKYYVTKYTGFDVDVLEVQIMGEITPPPPPTATKVKETIRYLQNMDFKLKPRFKDLYSVAEVKRGEFRKAEGALKKAVAEMVRSRPGVNSVDRDCIEISYSYDTATVKNVGLDFDVLKQAIQGDE